MASRKGCKNIQDEFTNLPVSRQRKWQLRKYNECLCIRCGKGPLASATYCERCLPLYNESQRLLQRKKNGVPLDAPKYIGVNRGKRVDTDSQYGIL